ncbi:DNA topoisomerase III [Syntrophomonas zehnderi OL-4]|uniref:DNA topoisomerase n=1 Tax=Syntrophomonas zehnderi OL-4 TaxID=690567 RepID=A0A0E4G9J9_9FIRM|nr:type IA DNA topoisomerase [Syntrophomonas zehnderi]CFX16139.1 DNA topoisomerase III [Syntrophomonas zehnderi OL-4]
MSVLIITEKPSVAMDIGKVLGGFSRQDGYLEKPDMIISWAVGHLVELAMPQDYYPELEKWNLNDLPILPEEFRLKPNPAARKQLQILKGLINRRDVNRLINACDAGREGELIFRNIIQFLNCHKPHDRLWLSETTPAAVKAAFNNLRSSAEVENLFLAATARSQADWLVGINTTRAYTTKYNEILTVGRVQTPTLALIVNRDQEIDGFVPQKYWEIEAKFNTGHQNYFIGKWFCGELDRFNSKGEAEAVLNKLIPGSIAQVVKVEQNEKTEQPPMLFNLTDLQKESNKQFGFTAEQTLLITQGLYEKRLLTYPRTDSRHLTEAMSATLPARLNALQKTELDTVVKSITNTDITNKRYVDDLKVSDHTAIVVTEVSPDLSALTADEIKIYILVAKRLVGIFLPPARITQTNIITSCQGETFKTKGKTLLEEGWKKLYIDDVEDGNDSPPLPVLIEGQEINLHESQVLDKQTQPPKRYNEADLLSAMENAGKQVEDEELREVMKGKGLGTPATRAAIIEKLISTGYITRQKKTLVATDKGKTLIDIVSTRLKDPEMTGEWEKKLIDIELGKRNFILFSQEIKQFTQDVVNEIKAQEVTTTSFTDRNSVGVCPLCGKPVIENKKAYSCSGWKEGCKFTIWKQIAGKSISQAQAKKIISKGKSDLIKGFKSRKDSVFDAYLRLDNGSIIFEFPKRNRKE